MTRILIADDDEQSLYMLQVLLKGYGYEVITAANGAEALEKARRDPPDMIITDILMPVMDGFTLCRQWKEDNRLKQFPFVFYTATYTDPRDEELALSLGAERFIIKPVEPDVFVGLLHEVIEEQKITQPIVQREPAPEEITYLREYNRVLIRKLEDKMLQLQESKEHYMQLADSITDVFFAFDEDLRYTYWNTACEELTGVSAEDAIGKSLYELFPDTEQIRRAESVYLDVLRTRQAQSFVNEYQLGGEDFFFEINAYPSKHGLSVFVKDITKRRQTEVALQESEELFRTIVEAAPSMLNINDVDGNNVYFSPNCEEIAGYTREELMDEFRWWVHEDDTERAREVFESIFREHVGVRDFEYKAVRKNGEVWYASSSWEPFRDENGEFKGIVAQTIDITERRRAEEKIRQQNEFLNSVLESLNHPFYTLDVHDYTIKMANSAARSGDLSEGITCYALTHKSSKPCSGECVCPIDIIRETKRSTVVEHIHYDKDGNPRNIEVHAHPILDSAGEVTQMIEYCLDITERKRMEEALKTSVRQWQTTFAAISDSVCLMDVEGRILQCNKATEHLLGKASSEIIDYACWEIVHGTSEPIAGCPVARMRETGRRESLTLPVGDQWLEVVVDPILDDTGNLVGAVHTISDITEKRRIESEILKVEKLESLGVLAGGIAHDLNNLLTGVVGNISLARLYDNLADKDRRLAEAEKSAMLIKELTQQLLTFSKGGVPILQTAAIGNLLKDSATFMLRGSNVRCEFSIPDDLLPVEVDEGQMSQVINNLVINSKQAMPEGGTIRISAENIIIGAEPVLPLEPGAYIKVSIEDEGIGIAKEHLERIFDPFFTTKQAGSGLGLATSYSIMEKHNGHITVESQIGVGTTFQIYLPASPAGALIEEQKEKEKPIMGEGRILMMDDEKHIRDLASDMLNKVGYKVITTIDGAEAIELYKEAMESGNPFDAVIMDLTVLGGMSGKEAVQKLIEIDPEVKAIVSSGYSNDPVMANFGEYGFKGVVAKPYKTRELSEVLHRVITGAD